MAQMSTTGSTARSAKVLFAALCAALAGCSLGSETPAGSHAAALRANASTTATLHVIVPPHSGQPKGLTLFLVVPGDRRADATIPLRIGGSCIQTDIGLECSAPIDNLTAGTHDLRIVLKAPSAKPAIAHVFVNIADCAANTIDLALYRRAARVAIASEDPNVIRRAGGYFGPFGSGTFNVAAIDGGGNTIVGLDAPAIAVKSSNGKIHAQWAGPNTLSLSLDGGVPFDSMFRGHVSLNAGAAQNRFTFETEFTTWPTASPSPSPAPCS